MSSYNSQRTHLKFMTAPGDRGNVLTSQERSWGSDRWGGLCLVICPPLIEEQLWWDHWSVTSLFLFPSFSTWGKETSYSCLYLSISITHFLWLLLQKLFLTDASTQGSQKSYLSFGLSRLMVLAPKRNRKALLLKVLSLNYYLLHQRLSDFSHCAILNKVAPRIQTFEGLSWFHLQIFTDVVPVPTGMITGCLRWLWTLNRPLSFMRQASPPASSSICAYVHEVNCPEIHFHYYKKKLFILWLAIHDSPKS